MTKEQAIYDLAKEIFLRKLPVDYLTEKSLKAHEGLMENAIRVAKLFYEQVEKDEQKSQQ
jgi:hypothetical protein